MGGTGRATGQRADPSQPFWQNWTRSTNIEDRRQEHSKEVDTNTAELKRFNNLIQQFVDTGGVGGTGGALTGRAGGLGAALGYGGGAAVPYGSSVGAGSGRGAGSTSPGGRTGGGEGTGRSSSTGGGEGTGNLPAGKPGNFTSANTWVVRDTIEKELISRGYTPEAAHHAAAALTGNAIAESGLNPSASHDHGTGYGIYGAGKDRKTKMLKWLKENGYAPNDLKGQARYMAIEADRDYPTVSKALRSAGPHNQDAVTDVVTRVFENPAIKNYGRRRNDAATAARAQPPKTAGGPDSPTTPQTAAAGTGASGEKKGTMIFIHGIKGKYGELGGSVEQTEADAKRIADAKGLKLKIVDNEEQAREALKDPSVKSVVGFSRGGNIANRIRGDYPDKEFTILSADKGTPGDIQYPGKHMTQVGQHATQLEQANAQAAAAGPTKPVAVAGPASTAVASLPPGAPTGGGKPGMTPLGVGGGTTPLPGAQGSTRLA